MLEVARGAEEIALAFAEVRLAVLRKDVLDRHLLRRLDQIVEVEERGLDTRGKLAPDGGFPRPHEPDKIDLHR
jgi:hypothetical protein